MDSPGHAGRWAIDASKIKPEFGRVLRETFESGVRKTGRWQLDNPACWGRIRSGVYRGERLGCRTALDFGSDALPMRPCRTWWKAPCFFRLGGIFPGVGNMIVGSDASP